MASFVSVERVWAQTVSALAQRFHVTVHETTDLDLSRSRVVRGLIDSVDLIVLLIPYYVLPPEREPPALIFALGSLQKGAHWMARHRANLQVRDTVVVNSTACLDI